VLAVAEAHLSRLAIEGEVPVIGPGRGEARHLRPALDVAVLLDPEVDRTALLAQVLLLE
jgi:hypothetical protein